MTQFTCSCGAIYDVIETEPGETFECASLVARDLVTSGQCELLAGGFFSVDDSGDVPKILPWVVTCTEYHRPHEEGPYETVETLRDAPYSPGWPAKRGVRLRIVLANFEGTFCYQDEPTEGYAFRVLRPNPNLKTVSINSEAQGKLVKQLWNQVFPQNPLTA